MSDSLFEARHHVDKETVDRYQKNVEEETQADLAKDPPQLKTATERIFGPMVRDVRGDLDFSRQDLAFLTNGRISKGQLAKIEASDSYPLPRSQALRLAHALMVDIQAIRSEPETVWDHVERVKLLSWESISHQSSDRLAALTITLHGLAQVLKENPTQK